MSHNISERDWKVFRELREVALGRLCDKILNEVKVLIDDPAKSSHEKYLKLYELIQKRDADIARAFNDLRRSTAVMQVGIIYKMGLFTEEEFQRLSPETLQVVALFAPIPDASS
jgi:hypothetical protein